MAEPFLGEIEAFAFNFAPKGWALCAGQVLPINQNTALFSLLGTTYGGNGTTTFQLPDLRGRVANAFGQGQGLGNYSLGQTGGQESHTLILNEMSSGGHSHAVTAKNNGTTGGTNTPSSAVGLGAAYASEAGSPAVNSVRYGCAHDRNGVARAHRRAAAREPHAIPWIELLHSAPRNLSVAQLRPRNRTANQLKTI